MSIPFLSCVIILLIQNQVVTSDAKHVLKGNDVHLLIQRPELIQDDAYRLMWKCNETNILEYYFNQKTNHTFPKYIGRVHFSVEKYDLLLENLQKTDNGRYEAIVTKDNNVVVAQYEVTVQDAVSPVHMTVDPVSSSPESCNLTVTCSSEGSSVANKFTCDNNQSCSQEGGENAAVMTSTGLLSVNVFEGSVICNHSNQVSMENTTTEIKPLCQPDSGHNDSRNDDSSHIVGISVGCVAGILCVTAVTIVGIKLHRKRGKWNATINDVQNTTYDSVQFQPSIPAMTNPDAANGQHPEHGDTSLTIYSLLQHPPGSVPTATTETSNTTPTNPESLYAQVQKPDRR